MCCTNLYMKKYFVYETMSATYPPVLYLWCDFQNLPLSPTVSKSGTELSLIIAICIDKFSHGSSCSIDLSFGKYRGLTFRFEDSIVLFFGNEAKRAAPKNCSSLVIFDPNFSSLVIFVNI